MPPREEALEGAAGNARHDADPRRYHRPCGDARRSSPPTSPTRSCIWPRKPMSTARSTARRRSSKPTSSAPTRCSTRRASTGRRCRRRARRRSASTTSPPTRCSAPSARPTRRSPRPPPYDPRSPYSASKAASDHLVRAWHHTYGLPTMVTNTVNNYGPWQFPEKLIPLVTLNALEGKTLPVYGDGSQRARLAVRGRPCRGAGAGARARRGGRDLRHRRPPAAQQPAGGARHLRRPRRPRARPGRPARAADHASSTDRPGHDFRYEIDPSRDRGGAGLACAA